jgi:hypothetical protein
MSRKIVLEGFTYVIRTRLGIRKKSADVSTTAVDTKGQGDQPEEEHSARATFQDNQPKESPSVVQK